jgi:hypothetical protein
MGFSLADYESKANNWLIPNVVYEGQGSAEFTSPNGSVMGQFVATFNDRGEQSLNATCEEFSCDPEYKNWGALAFLSGAKIERQNNVESWGFGGLDNTCKELKITTPSGTFIASDVQLAGMTAQMSVGKPEDIKPSPLQFRVSQGKFETGNLNKPKFFALPLLNCIAETGNTIIGAHPLRIYPTPLVPDSLEGKERTFAILASRQHNSVIGFHVAGRLCFIERLADYDQRLASLKSGTQCTVTAVLVGELGEEPVSSLEEFFSWFPMEIVSALGFASGVEVSASWVEIRDEQGDLIRRLHGRAYMPIFDEGDVLLTRFDVQSNSGMGPFLTSYLNCAPDKRFYLEAVMNHSRLGSLGTSLRLYDILDHLVRAFECLCREHGFISQHLLPRLTAPIQNQVKDILSEAGRALQSLISGAQQNQDFDSARLLMTIKGRVANAATIEKRFGLAVIDLLKHFALPDAGIIDLYISQNPRPDNASDWASVLSNYRGATIHEGYMDFDKKHDADDVISICAHLKDVLTRIIWKEVGYTGTYKSVLRRSYGPQVFDWIQPTTPPKNLGFI